MSERFKKHHSDGPRRKIILVGTIVVVGGVYALHRKKLNEVVRMSQEAVEYTMDESFEAGIKYGLKLAKDVGLGAVDKAQTASEYAFGAFDNAADKAAWAHTTPA